MNKKYWKFITYGIVVLVAVAGTVIAVGPTFAQVSGLNCDSTSSGYVGKILCSIGSVADGIPGASTLFQGQKALFDKVSAISGGDADRRIKIIALHGNSVTQTVDCGVGWQIAQCGQYRLGGIGLNVANPTPYPVPLVDQDALAGYKGAFMGGGTGDPFPGCPFSAYGAQSYSMPLPNINGITTDAKDFYSSLIVECVR